MTKADLEAAGYKFDDFTPEERSCISEKISKLRDEGKPQDQAVAIAISMCAPSKAKACAGTATATFAADQPTTAAPGKIKIKGADYRWSDTKDGYCTVHDVHLMSEVKKGVKGAPRDIGKEDLEGYARTAQERYHAGHFCATAFKGHNPEIEITSPDFYGYVLPNRVGLAKLEGEDGKLADKWTVFGDVKLNKAAFEKARRGEIPYHSPEVPWSKGRISGLAFLDTKPPYFEYPLFTLGEEIKGSSAKFEAVHSWARFMEDGEKPGCKACEEKDRKIADLMARMSKYESKDPTNPLEAKMSAKDQSTPASQETPKPTPLPVEPTDSTKKEPAKMDAALDPKLVAIFEGQSARIKALEDERAKDRAAAEQKARVDWAMGELKGHIVSDSLPTTLATFAADEANLKRLVEELKKTLPKAPPSTMAEFKGAAVEPGDPVLAKFAQQGPQAHEKAAKFAAEYREMTRRGWGLKRNEAEYIEFRMKETA